MRIKYLTAVWIRSKDWPDQTRSLPPPLRKPCSFGHFLIYNINVPLETSLMYLWQNTNRWPVALRCNSTFTNFQISNAAIFDMSTVIPSRDRWMGKTPTIYQMPMLLRKLLPYPILLWCRPRGL